MVWPESLVAGGSLGTCWLWFMATLFIRVDVTVDERIRLLQSKCCVFLSLAVFEKFPCSISARDAKICVSSQCFSGVPTVSETAISETQPLLFRAAGHFHYNLGIASAITHCQYFNVKNLSGSNLQSVDQDKP